jgi:GNAT superfamily N-acetyltransferase
VLVVAKRDRIARDAVFAVGVGREVAAAGARVVSASSEGKGDAPADAFLRTVIDGGARYEHGQVLLALGFFPMLSASSAMILEPRTGQYRIRPIDRDTGAEIELVADRMRSTLIEVLGYDVGANMYSMDWLRARVRWHLDPAQCTGEVFVAENDDEIVGHTVVRLGPGGDGDPVGLFSTIYLVPRARRRGVADALVLRGEAWFAAHGISTIGTSTSETNNALFALFAKHGYTIVLRAPESQMIHLSKTVGRVCG